MMRPRVKITHLPTGLSAESDVKRLSHQRAAAMRSLRAQLAHPIARPLELVRSYEDDFDSLEELDAQFERVDERAHARAMERST